MNKVSIVPCPDYSEAAVSSALDALLQSLGGFDWRSCSWFCCHDTFQIVGIFAEQGILQSTAQTGEHCLRRRGFPHRIIKTTDKTQ